MLFSLAVFPNIARAQYDLQFGMHELRMGKKTPADILSRAQTIKENSQQTSKTQTSISKEQQIENTIWQSYKAIDQAKPVADIDQQTSNHTNATKLINSNGQITNPALTTRDINKAQPYRAQTLLNNYKDAQQQRQQVRSLHFKTPTLDEKDQ